jgi:hypothetical protein
MGKQQKIKAARAAERARERGVVDDLVNAIHYQRIVAHHDRNHLNVTVGETLEGRQGWIPNPADPEGMWIRGELKRALVHVAQLPSWPTHAVFSYTVDQCFDSARRVRRVRHLSITMSVPILTTTAELRPIKDAFLSRTFPVEMLGLWFPDAEGVLSVIRAGDPAPDQEGTIWTPVTVHFYVDHDNPNTADPPPRLYDGQGRPL